MVDLFDQIIRDTDYEKYIKDQSEENNDRWENVQELRRLAYDFQEKGLTEFLQNLALVSDQDTIPSAVDQEGAVRPQGAVTLLTLHAAKGLEFNQVFIIGLDEGLLPMTRSRDDHEKRMEEIQEEIAEERRLFYVGITRARNQLYLLRCERRLVFRINKEGRSIPLFDECEPSRFIDDIDQHLIFNQGMRSISRRDTRMDDMRWSTTTVSPSRRTTYAAPAEKETKYKAGMRVRNATWGEGLVLESKLDSDYEEIVTVHFDSVGLKRLLSSSAKLEIISSPVSNKQI